MKKMILFGILLVETMHGRVAFAQPARGLADDFMTIARSTKDPAFSKIVSNLEVTFSIRLKSSSQRVGDPEVYWIERLCSGKIRLTIEEDYWTGYWFNSPKKNEEVKSFLQLVANWNKTHAGRSKSCDDRPILSNPYQLERSINACPGG